MIIVLGEDLTRFRDASKDLHNFLRAYSWNDKVQRLGFDEVWLDVTPAVDYNVDVLNTNNTASSFFQTSKTDPTMGFTFDAATYSGDTYPAIASESVLSADRLGLRLVLGSHLAHHMRQELQLKMGYTATVGISTSRLLSKLVGNCNKPNGQTTLVPPYESSVTAFLDAHDIGAVPWIGFKMAQKLREAVLGRSPQFAAGLVYGGTKETVTVQMVRQLPGLTVGTLENLLGGPGAPKGVGASVFRLVHGVDDSDVAQARGVPRQISIEDSYVRLDRMEQVTKELVSLSSRLLQRMRTDLLSADGDETVGGSDGPIWLARPSTLRLSTRPRPPLAADGTRVRAFNRISRSTIMPSFVFRISDDLEGIADRLVSEELLPLFRQLHPEESGWNLSLVNVAAINMLESGGDSKSAGGRDIKRMFDRQTDVLEEFKIKPENVLHNMPYDDHRPLVDGECTLNRLATSNQADVKSDHDSQPPLRQRSMLHDAWEDSDPEDEEEVDPDVFPCSKCGRAVPLFAEAAHARFHAVEEHERMSAPPDISTT